MAEHKLPIRGKDVAVTVFIDGRPQEQTDQAQSVSIDEVNTQHAEKLLNEPLDQLDETPGHFDIELKMRLEGSALYFALDAHKRARAARTFPLPVIAVGMVFAARDGSGKFSLMASPVTTKQNLNSASKDDAVVQSLRIQAGDVKPATL